MADSDIQTDAGQEQPYSQSFQEACLLEAVGRTWEVVLLREGWSKNGRFYTREALQEAVPLLEGVSINAYGWSPDGQDMGHVPDHVRNTYGGASGLAANKVGWITEAQCRTAPDGLVEAVGTFHCVDPQISARLREAWAAGNRGFLGFSIDGAGDWHIGTAQGRRGPIVSRITSLSEVTLVTDPAAGGRFTRLVAGNIATEEPMSKMASFLRARLPKSLAAGVDKMDEKRMAEAVVSVVASRLKTRPFKKARLAEEIDDSTYLELVKSQIESDPAMANELIDVAIAAEQQEEAGGEGGEAPPEEESPVSEEDGDKPGSDDDKERLHAQQIGVGAPGMMEAVKKAERRIALMESQALLRVKLAESGLPKPAQEFLRDTFANDVLTEAQIDKAIGKQRAILAESAGGNHVMGGQVRTAKVTDDRRDKMQRAMDLICGYVPKESEQALYEAVRPRPGVAPSVRELYLSISGDYGWSGRVAAGNLQEATTADFPTLLGTSLTKALVDPYQEYQNPFEPLVNINPNVSNFMTQDRVQLWGFGRMPVVAEGAAYPDGGIPREEHSTYSVAKRGLTATITIEMIANDNLGALQNLPRELALAAKNEEAYFMASLLTGAVGGTVNGDVTYDGLAIYHANHRNITTDALSHQALLNARTALRKQFRRGTSTTSAMNYSSGGTTYTCVSTAGFKAGDHFQVDAEIFRIASVDSGTSMTVAGAQLGTTAANHDGSSTAKRLYQLTQPVPISKVYVVVPDDLESTLDVILRTEKVPGSANWDVNLLQAAYANGTIVPIVGSGLHLGGDINNWYQVADPKIRPGIEVAYLNNRREPEILIADMPTVGAMFTNDQLVYKGRHIYGGVVTDPFGLYGAIVA